MFHIGCTFGEKILFLCRNKIAFEVFDFFGVVKAFFPVEFGCVGNSFAVEARGVNEFVVVFSDGSVRKVNDKFLEAFFLQRGDFFGNRERLFGQHETLRRSGKHAICGTEFIGEMRE